MRFTIEGIKPVPKADKVKKFDSREDEEDFKNRIREHSEKIKYTDRLFAEEIREEKPSRAKRKDDNNFVPGYSYDEKAKKKPEHCDIDEGSIIDEKV